MNLKGFLLGGALALAAQGAEANQKLVCTSSSPLVDNINIVKTSTKAKIENRLKAIDSEMHHQVVVYTVSSLEDYGYGSIAEMANAIGTDCKIGYRGEDTGVVVLYVKSPSRYRIETASTERYLTDAKSSNILEKSKSSGACSKEDVDCRLDFITGEIDKVIRNEFKGASEVKQLVDSTKNFDDAKESKFASEMMTELGMSALVIVVLGGAGFGIFKGASLRKRNNRKKELKKKIFELNALLLSENQKYPTWFQNENMGKLSKMIEEMLFYTDEDLNDILESVSRQRSLDDNITKARQQMESWESSYKKDMANRDIFLDDYKSLAESAEKLKEGLISKGYKFSKINISKIDEENNPSEVISQIKIASEKLSKSLEFLNGIEFFYDSISDLDKNLEKESNILKKSYEDMHVKYQEIYFKAMPFDFLKTDKEILELSQDFSIVYSEKDIVKLKILEAKAELVFSDIKKAIDEMKDAIKWYEGIPGIIESKKKLLEGINFKQEYEKESQAYAYKTGKKDFLTYDMLHSIATLGTLLKKLSSYHKDKANLDKIELGLKEFDAELFKMKEYMRLGASLAAILAAEALEASRKIREAAESEEREKRKKIQEEEDEKRRRHRQAQDEEDSRRRRNDDNSSSSSFTSGGGSGFSGGGADSD